MYKDFKLLLNIIIKLIFYRRKQYSKFSGVFFSYKLIFDISSFFFIDLYG